MVTMSTPGAVRVSPRYVPGISLPRWKAAATFLAIVIALIVAVANFIIIDISAAGTSPILEWLSSAPVAPAFVLLPFLATSILVLRLTHAVADHRRNELARGAESRSELAGGLCCLLAVFVACLVQPAAWTQEGMAAWGVAGIVLALLSIVFQFFLGAAVAPDARVQLQAERLAVQGYERALAILRARGDIPRGRAIVGLVAVGVVVVVVLPLLFGLVGLRSGQGGEVVGVALVLAVTSSVAIAFGQLAQVIGSRAGRRVVIGVALVFAAGGWLAIAVLEVWGFIATGDVAWLGWAAAFLIVGLICVAATVTRRTTGWWTLRAAIAALQAGWIERRIAACEGRIAQLDRIIDAERPLSKLRRTADGVRRAAVRRVVCGSGRVGVGRWARG